MALLEKIVKEIVALPFQEIFIANYLSWDRIAFLTQPVSCCIILLINFLTHSFLLRSGKLMPTLESWKLANIFGRVLRDIRAEWNVFSRIPPE